MKVSKILICGISGAGKTTLTKKLSEKYGYKPVHLDKFFWQENWTKTPEQEFYDLLDKETSQDNWILEGALLKIVRRYVNQVDLVIWLCPNRFVAIYRVLKRMLLTYGKVREDLASGCYEKMDLSFIKWIWDYPNSKYPELEKILNQSGVQFLKITNSLDLKNVDKVLRKNNQKFK